MFHIEFYTKTVEWSDHKMHLMQFKGVNNQEHLKCLRSAIFVVCMPSSWLHLWYDSLAHSVFLCDGFCQLFPPLSPPATLCCFFSTDVFFSVTGACSFPFVWGLMDGLHCCASHWALFQSRGWLPIVEATGYSRHPTSILAMQLFNGTI